MKWFQNPLFPDLRIICANCRYFSHRNACQVAEKRAQIERQTGQPAKGSFPVGLYRPRETLKRHCQHFKAR